MSDRRELSAERKAHLLQRSSLLRMQVALAVDDVRAALRPGAIFSALLSRPGTVLTLLSFVVPLLRRSPAAFAPRPSRFWRWLKFSRLGIFLFSLVSKRFFGSR